MNNKIKKFIAGVMVGVVAITGSSVISANAASKSIGLNINCMKVMQGDKVNLRVEYNETAQDLKCKNWKSDDTKVAKISQDGKVTATGAGITFVHGTYKGKDYKCKVYVLNGCRKNGKHTYRTETVYMEPSCSFEGVIVKKCIECGKEKKVTTKKNPNFHEYIDWETGDCEDCGKHVSKPHAKN